MKEKNSVGHLFKNIGLLSISNFSSKILSFLLVPLYTGILSTTEYGIYDLYTTTVPILYAILTCNVCDCVLRFALDDTYDKKDVFSIGMRRCLLSTVFFASAVCLLRIIPFFHRLIEYPFLLIGYYFVLSFYEMIVRFVRGLDKIKVIAIGGVISTISLLTCSILFLYVFNMGLNGYFFAVYLSFLLPILYYVITLKLWKFITYLPNKEVNRSINQYGFPLIFDAIGWWVNNALDRYVVTFFCGFGANGIYSVSYKIPSVINSVQSIFNQAWVISAVEEYKKQNFIFLKKTYNYYCTLLILVASALLVFNKQIALFLFAKEFYIAWMYSTFLIVSVVFGAISSFEEGIFVAAKETKILARSTIIGAIVNGLLNLILVYGIGVVGAALATMISYFVIWFIRTKEMKNKLAIDFFDKRHYLCFAILTVQASVSSFVENNFFLSFVLAIVIMGINYKYILLAIRNIVNKIPRKA